MEFTLINALETCYAEMPAIVAVKKIDHNFRILDTEYYNGNTIPLMIENYPVSHTDLLTQYDGSQCICFIAYEQEGKPYKW